jgi:hypothetical protein
MVRLSLTFLEGGKKQLLYTFLQQIKIAYEITRNPNPEYRFTFG